MSLRPIRSFLVVLAMSAAGAHAAPATAPHAAACVAALKANETELAETFRSGQQVAARLRRVVESGIAIIGAQYLAGLAESEARRLLQSAEQEFSALPPTVAQARQAECLREGQALYQGASPLERTLIRSAAKRRMHRLGVD